MTRIACLCPTYKRPECLANVAECFSRQTYPEDLRRLFILDDANQHRSNPDFPSIQVTNTPSRLKSLPEKFNSLATLSQDWEPDVFAIWEDDDVFLPWHLDSISNAVDRGGEYLISEEVWSTYQEPKGGMHLEGAAGRFHSSWAFTSDLFNRVGGYPDTSRLDFDQQMGFRLRQVGTVEHYSDNDVLPSYVYRWGNPTYHGSQAGEEGFQSLWDSLAGLPSPLVGPLQPRFDSETTLIYGSDICVGHTV